MDKKAYQDQLTPAQTAAMAEEKRQKMAKRRAIRKKRVSDYSCMLSSSEAVDDLVYAHTLLT